MITKEMLAQAIKTQHLPCANDCIHGDAFEECKPLIDEEINKCIVIAMAEGVSPAAMVYSSAMHVGYRLGELMYASVSTDKLN